MTYIINRINFILFIQFLFTSVISNAQRIINNESTHYSIENNSIDFLIIDNNIKVKKPLFIWFQGSRPYPLYTEKNNKLHFWGGGISNFNIDELRKKYHVVVISMPTVPVIVNEDDLSNSFQFVPNKEIDEPSIEYQKADNLDNYVDRAKKVVKFLNSKNWVDSSKLILASHSQGTRIASRFALINNVDILALFSPNPLSRITEMIKKPYQEARDGKITWTAADEQINYYNQLSEWIKDENIVKENPSLISWKSFNNKPIDDWLNLKSKLYIAYGTEDNAADICNLIPYLFIENDKTIPTIKKYINREHNFFEIKNGVVDYKTKDGWEIAFSDFVEWLNHTGN